MSDRRVHRWIFALILSAWLAYAAGFVYRTSFVVQGERYFCLFDDAMISMTYARNLAEGHGLVWFPGGERVEGFTNPLWTLWMALLHLVPLSAARISLLVQATSAGLLALNLFLVKRLADRLSGGSGWVWIPAVALTAFYLPLNHWALQGMEVGLLAVLTTAAAGLALKALQERRFYPGLYLLLGAALLVRLDAAVLYLVVWGYLLGVDAPHRRRHLVWGLSLFLGINLVMTGLRLAYYGDLLPNTYYLKMTGIPLALRLARGGQACSAMIRQMAGILFVLPFSALLWRQGRRQLLLPAGIFLGQAAYSVWVGGDAWEYWGLTNRYMTAAMPLFLTMLACSVARLAQEAGQRLTLTGKGQVHSLALLILLLAAVDFNFIYSPNPSLKEWLLLRPPLAVKDNRDMVEQSRLIQEIASPRARIGVTWAGIIPYFSRRPAVDFLGKNDRHIAHLPAHLPASGDLLSGLRPGHSKWDYDYSICRLQPEVVAQFYGLPLAQAERYVEGSYRKVTQGGRVFHLRKDSPAIHWETVEVLEVPP